MKNLVIAAAIATGVLIGSSAVNAAPANPVHKQLDELATMAKGKRLAFLTNGSARTAAGQHDVDYFLTKEGTTVTAFFGPEHGFRGNLADGAKSLDGHDDKTGVPIFSLYGKRTAPSDDQLKNVDMFVFDIPDVGVRFYTYIWTMTHAMESCAKNNIPFVVIDRPNPITGAVVAGGVNEKDDGLVGRLGHEAKFGIATRHGMTAGELATLWNNEWMEPKVDLHVIKMTDWKRDQWWDETGREFIAPSPNMRSLTAATVYPGTCIFEGTNLSEGRGTTAPFELIGAPFVDGKAWADELNARNIQGVKFLPVTFTPDSRRHKGEKCGGVQVVVTDRDHLESVTMGLHMLQTVKKRYPDQVKITDYAGRLMATPDLEKRIVNEEISDIVNSYEPVLEQFMPLREKALLYP